MDHAEDTDTVGTTEREASERLHTETLHTETTDVRALVGAFVDHRTTRLTGGPP